MNLDNIRFCVYHNFNSELLSDINGVVKNFAEDIAVTMSDGTRRVMDSSIARIPSSKNPANRLSLPAGYQMTDLTSDTVWKQLSALSRAMGIDKPTFTCSGPRKNLANSDLYFLRYICTEKAYRDKGYEEIFLSRISEQLRSLMREPHPVIVASPYVQRNFYHISDAPSASDNIERLQQFMLDAGFKPVRKNSKWLYLSE